MTPARVILGASLPLAAATIAHAQPAITWSTIDGGGGASAGGSLNLTGTIGQPDAGSMSGGTFALSGGFWAVTLGQVCYANCDASTITPILNVNDFSCFINAYAAGSALANCDASTITPILNVNDFSCFLNAYAAGCP